MDSYTLTPAPKNQQRRRSQRYGASISVEFQRNSTVYVRSTRDICADGLSFNNEGSFPRGQLLIMRLILPNETVIEAPAMVARSDQRSRGGYRIGVKFFALSGDLRQAWFRFVRETAREQGHEEIPQLSQLDKVLSVDEENWEETRRVLERFAMCSQEVTRSATDLSSSYAA